MSLPSFAAKPHLKMAQYFYVQRMDEMKATIENQEQRFQCVYLDIHVALNVVLTLQSHALIPILLLRSLLARIANFLPAWSRLYPPPILHLHYVRPNFESRNLIIVLL